MVNISSLLDTILTCFGYILGFLWSFLASDEGGKNTDRGAYIMAVSIESTCARNTYIGSTFATSAWIKYANIKGAYTRGIYVRNVSIGGIKPQALASWTIPLVTYPKVNNNGFWLFIGLIFAIIDGMSYWKIGNS